MKNIYAILVFFMIFISIYYLGIGNSRTAAVTFLNTLCFVFLISRNTNLKSYLYSIILTVVSLEFIIFSFNLISNIDVGMILSNKIFIENLRLTSYIYNLKGDKVFGLDTNIIASFYAVLVLIFKEFNKKKYTFLSFIFLFICYSRSALALTSLLLLYPSKKINIKYLYIIIGIIVTLFLTYKGDNYDLNVKLSTYQIFFNSINDMTPKEFLFGLPNFSIQSQEIIIGNIGKIYEGHTLIGTFLMCGLVYFFAPFSIFLLIYQRHRKMRLAILFLLLYSIFSVTVWSVPLPLLVLSTVFDEREDSKIN